MACDGEQLLAAAKEDLDQVKQLVEGGADVRAIDEVRALFYQLHGGLFSESPVPGSVMHCARGANGRPFGQSMRVLKLYAHLSADPLSPLSFPLSPLWMRAAREDADAVCCYVWSRRHPPVPL